jgi:hypothetical protein
MVTIGMSKRQARTTKRERKARRLEQQRASLIAARVNLAPSIQDLVRGKRVTDLLVRPSDPYRKRIFLGRGDGSGGGHLRVSGGGLGRDMLQALSPRMTLTLEHGAMINGSDDPVYLEPGGKIQILDSAYVEGVGYVGPLEIAVEEHGDARSARVSTPDWCVLSIVRYKPQDKFAEQRDHGHLVAAALSAEARVPHDVVAERAGAVGALGEPTDVLVVEKVGGHEVARLQMRHVSEDLARLLGVANAAAEVRIDRETIRQAINKKSIVAAEHDLVLHVPAPLGAPFRRAMMDVRVAHQGWRRVWLSEAGLSATLLQS